MSSNSAAVIETENARLKVIDRPIPTPSANELVVRNYAIAANPVDWKIQDHDFFLHEYPNVLGSDVSGIITHVGSSVTKFRVGDRVAGFAAVIYNKKIDHGAWQTYTVLRDVATTKIPDAMKFEEASVFPMAMATAAVALFVNLEIPKPTAESIETKKEALLVWGGASSVGMCTIQLARKLGYKVFATASPAHHQTLKDIGAFAVFDYRDEKVAEKIVNAAKEAGTPLVMGFDTITEVSTSRTSASILRASGGKGSKLVLVLPWPDTEEQRKDIAILNTGAFRLGTDQEEIGKWFFNEYLQAGLADGSIVSAPKVEIVQGGLAAAQTALDKNKAGISGRKLVVKVE